MTAVSGAAQEFLLKYRAELFTRVPIVPWPVDAHPTICKMQRSQGVAVIKSVSSTLEIALRLRPDTRAASGVSEDWIPLVEPGSSEGKPSLIVCY